ncbi:nose resistant to fluoxetine protein 6 isoform X2 [Eurytemora carolleeae]|uniref:nose resistant to fluoxetine protein 6 isoform X2 n=1 Tax=Eurytemora carolleeae TaxID=1294199 RepID=UPI000C78069F|nr:nose resistant to fluoxetine protein 6 isoform X2 [Eurytemora carolleeae]|eukprot:XP_023337485.1 nose resistant to fluoxetine protein 6-like isoform X2 [Eurytemora affinis]
MVQKWNWVVGILATVHASSSTDDSPFKSVIQHWRFNKQFLFPSEFQNAEAETDWIPILQNFLTPIEGNISVQCRADSLLYMSELNGFPIGASWAYKMFDASAKLLQPSLLQGNLKQLGSFDSCLEVEAPNFIGKHCTFSFQDPNWMGGGAREFEQYTAKYQHLKRKLREEEPSLLQYMTLGRCIPDSCSEADLKASLAVFMNETQITGSPYVLNCHSNSPKDATKPTTGDYFMFTIIGLFSIVIIIGTFIDLTIKFFQADIYSERCIQVFQGFSAYSNIVKLFSTNNVRSDSLTCINGIRFISMTWVLLGHSYSNLQGTVPVANLLSMMELDGPIYGSVAFQAVLNAFPSVDTFFFIGATLLAYLTLKELDKTKGGNVQFWIMYYAHRYIRLTGVYLIVIGLLATVFKYFATGPQSVLVLTSAESCQQSWWVNALYINNIYPQFDMSQPWCLGQTWYMANDMQFFIISPIFIYAMWKMPIAGLIISSAGLLAGTIIPMVIVWKRGFPISVGFLSATSGGIEYFMDFYIVPWCRFQPYICGLMFGYLLHYLRDEPKLKINPIFITWIWATAGAIGAVVIYGLYPYVDDFMLTQNAGSLAARVAYNGLHRLAWSVCIGWVILACVKGQGGPINSILSWPAWIPLARLSYCIYLVHIDVIAYFASIITFTVYSSHSLALYWNIAMLCFSTFVAFIIVIMFEMPLAHIEKVAFASIGIGRYPNVKTYPKDI